MPGAVPGGKVAWGFGALVLGWTVLAVVAEPWPEGPTHDVRITKYGSLVMPSEGEPTPSPSVRIMRASAGRCEINVALGTDHEVKPGSLVLLFQDPNAPPVAAGEILLSKPESSDARLLGYWADCPALYEVRRTSCPDAATAIVRSRPKHLGPEEEATWSRELRDVAARVGCAAWELPVERPRIEGVDDYERP